MWFYFESTVKSMRIHFILDLVKSFQVWRLDSWTSLTASFHFIWNPRKNLFWKINILLKLWRFQISKLSYLLYLTNTSFYLFFNESRTQVRGIEFVLLFTLIKDSSKTSYFINKNKDSIQELEFLVRSAVPVQRSLYN